MLDSATCYRACISRDARFDGYFYVAVTSTGVYCRPSCPAMSPKLGNARYYPSAAAAQRAGFRACKRCRPDAVPGSPEWNVRGDVVGRAMRLIADGVVDRDGVAGLARRLHFSERHLHRQLVAEVGAGPKALARAQRARSARSLIENTGLGFSTIAFASGFNSIRQFNDTIRAVYASTPTELRARRRPGAAGPDDIVLRLPFRAPFDAASLLAFFAARAIPGLEEVGGGVYRRAMALPHGHAVVALEPVDDHVVCRLRLADVRDVAAATARCRALLDLDADPKTIDEHLSSDPILSATIRDRPGRRVPGTVDPFEACVRAVVGQQITVRGARTILGRIVEAAGRPLAEPEGTVTLLFPDARSLAAARLSRIGLTSRRAATVQALAEAVAEGQIDLGPGADRAETTERLSELPGVGAWTTAYIAMRALRDPDAFPVTDLGIRKAMERFGVPGPAIPARAERWRPWRAYAAAYLWGSL